jgi:hypothetical protein
MGGRKLLDRPVTRGNKNRSSDHFRGKFDPLPQGDERPLLAGRN